MYLKKSIDQLINIFLADDLQCVACERYCQLQRWQMCCDCVQQLEVMDFELSAEQYYLRRLIACFFYNDFAQKLVYAHKSGGQRFFSKIFSKMIEEKLNSADITIDCITWVPTAKKKIAVRGCDHAKDIACELARRLELPLMPLLEKNERHKAQKKLSKEERIINMVDAFNCEQLIREELHILIIDDVITTGATIASAAKTILQRNPNCRLYGATVFYTPNKSSVEKY